MPDIVIHAETPGKHDTTGHQAENGRYVALRDVLVNNARSLWRTTADLLRGKPIIQGNNLEEGWALKDVSFEIRRGEAVGTGSHPELTGRRTLTWNGVILGMWRAGIVHKVGKIVKRLFRRNIMSDKQAIFLSLVLEVNDDGYLASVPDMQGAFAEGDTVEEAIFNCIDVVKMIAAYRAERGESLGFNKFALAPNMRLTMAVPVGVG